MSNRDQRGQSGFSLLEVMIAMTILAVGILVIAQMQIAAIRGLTYSRRLSSATQLAQFQMEQLRTLPFSTGVSDDSNYNNVLEDDVDGDGNFSGWHYYSTPLNEEGNTVPAAGGGMKYYVHWRVDKGPAGQQDVRGTGQIEYPGPGQMRIEVEVLWFDEELPEKDFLKNGISRFVLPDIGGHRVRIRSARSITF